MIAPVFSVSIEPIWGNIRQIRGEVGVLLQEQPAELRLAVMMAASELLENAVKYGDSVVQAPRILFSLSLADGIIRLRTVNGSNEPENVERLQTRLRELETTEDPMALYFQTIQQMLARPPESGGAGLGLYRIAAEGGFALSWHCDDGLVSIVATRSIA
ncbi:MAG: hypothetical protein JW940_32945 [Polyangiaceae bacterium]|nr:hypothetical protein [Polyangiaceae bacterium]